ncbi:camphor resistance protein CrcB [Murinocardiopsis flavida]|uniref:Fluoride-specific ion channel FluC n=1 Tax=Murinocardiopsis flavida TaxID=645275 RepID=A0A2P8D8V0_9ACTN|nr:CrcB family protein [Murinocardiopsis flavida]PSK93644.1 camphor resistance protein CrcB [Murinocardiopsis flavida]
MTVVLVALGAAVGAPLRYLTDRAVQARCGTLFPWGTFTVNAAGCLILGALTALPLPPHAMALLGTGLCGALTTYSTFAYETLRLSRDGARPLAVLYTAAGLLAGIGAAVTGSVLARAVAG